MERRGRLAGPRRTYARRRAAALVAVALTAGAVGMVVGLSSGSGEAGRDAAPARAAKSRHGTAPVRVAPYRRAVPVLMYHVVERAAGRPFPDLYVPPPEFSAQMRWLARRGFRGVTLERVERAWRGRALLPRRPIVVSFDDGYRSQYTRAFPVLRRLGWPAVLSLTVANMKASSGLPAADVERLVKAGWELASHTITHPDLRALGARRLRHEVRDSRRILRYVFRVPVDNFTYPAGDYDSADVAAVRRAGYRGALTVAPGLARPSRLFELRRIRVDPGDGVRGLARKLALAGG